MSGLDNQAQFKLVVSKTFSFSAEHGSGTRNSDHFRSFFQSAEILSLAGLQFFFDPVEILLGLPPVSSI